MTKPQSTQLCGFDRRHYYGVDLEATGYPQPLTATVNRTTTYRVNDAVQAWLLRRLCYDGIVSTLLRIGTTSL